jgi:alpha-ribazole phosphatase/probable phosphoglycerate mutase
VVLVRHGEVEERYLRCYNGHNDIALSPQGRGESRALAQKLEHERFDAIYCSDLRRTRETLEAFAHAKNAVYTEALREKSWGKHEGLTFDAILAQGELAYDDFLGWIEGLDGEPYKAYLQRIEDFFLEFLPAQNHQNVLIITHAGVIRSLVHIVQKIPLEEAFCISIPYSSAVVYYPFCKEGACFDFSFYSS